MLLSAELVVDVFMVRCCPVSTDRVISERTVVIMVGGRFFRRVSTIVYIIVVVACVNAGRQCVQCDL